MAIGGLHGGTGFAAHPLLLFPLMLVAAMLAGALLLVVPALLRTRLGVDEVVTTLLLNFIVLLFVSMMLDGPMKDPDRDGVAAERRAAGRTAARQADRAHARAHGSAVGASGSRCCCGRCSSIRRSGSRCARSAPTRAAPRSSACR